jgi:alkylhydroperoxidase family enzyme
MTSDAVREPAAHAAGFLGAPEVDPEVRQMYAGDLHGQGYVANQTRLWAYAPGALAALSHAMSVAVDMAGLDMAERSLLVTATASALGDSYCTLAWGSKLARYVGADSAAATARGDDSTLEDGPRAIAAWARQVVRDPNGTDASQVERLRALGLDDRQVFAVTLFVALRIAFSTVNDALGAVPDQQLVAGAPAALVDAVDFGRLP